MLRKLWALTLLAALFVSLLVVRWDSRAGGNAVAQTPGARVTYLAGWNLVAGPDGTVVLDATPPLATFQAGDTAYRLLPAGTPLTGGVGYWAFFPAPATTTLPAGGLPAFSVVLPPGQWVLIGNPDGSRALRVAGADAVYVYDVLAGYQAATVLLPGQGAWAFSWAGGTTTLALSPPATSPSVPPNTAPTGLHVAGRTLQDAGGRPVQLHGVNRSSWEYVCLDGSGQTHDGSADQTEINAMVAWRINAVRVVLNEDCWLGINGVTVGGAAYQTAVKDYVTLLTQNAIVPIVNLHVSAPGTITAGTYESGGQQHDQFPMPDRDHAPAFWASVATTFKPNSLVIFEPYNEPFPDADTGGDSAAAWTCWRDGGSCPAVRGFPDYASAGMQELVTAIRTAGATNVIILPGINWGSQVDQWLQYKPVDPLGQLAVGWHSYGDGLSCQTIHCWTTTLATVIQQVPLVATEIGEFDCGHSYVDQVMRFLDSTQQSYLAWVWGPYDCAKDPALLQDWSGTPTQSFGQGVHDHLRTLK